MLSSELIINKLTVTLIEDRAMKKFSDPPLSISLNASP
jgi:hypothetical protein